MTDRWALVVHEPTLNVLFSCRLGERRRLVKAIDDLLKNPYRAPDYQETDKSGRTHNVMLAGKWAVVYWLDHFDKELRIVRLDKADV